MTILTYTPTGLPVTRSGLIIGSAYTPPPARMGSHAIAIQGGLLRRQPTIKPRKVRAIQPRRSLPTLTPTTRFGRLLVWVQSLFNR